MKSQKKHHFQKKAMKNNVLCCVLINLLDAPNIRICFSGQNLMILIYSVA